MPNTEGIPLADEYVNLVLKMDALDGGEPVERECRIDAGHSRKFVGAAGVGHGVECGECCQAVFASNRTWNHYHNNDNEHYYKAGAI